MTAPSALPPISGPYWPESVRQEMTRLAVAVDTLTTMILANPATTSMTCWQLGTVRAGIGTLGGDAHFRRSSFQP